MSDTLAVGCAFAAPGELLDLLVYVTGLMCVTVCDPKFTSGSYGLCILPSASFVEGLRKPPYSIQTLR